MNARSSRSPAAGGAADDTAFKAANRTRFETDLEFVQCLANPFYLQTLAQQSILSSPAFLGYLEYLQYFKQPRYARFIQYPQCLHHLELCVKSESFREAIRHDTTVGELAREQTEHWRTWREELESYPATAATAPSQRLQSGTGQVPDAKGS